MYRHEWISLRLFQAFVGDSTDDAWLQRLLEPSASDDASWLAEGASCVTGWTRRPPKQALRHPAAAGPGHGLAGPHPSPFAGHAGRGRKGRRRWLGAKVRTSAANNWPNLLKAVDADWNELRHTQTAAVEAYWQFPHGLPVTVRHGASERPESPGVCSNTPCAPARDWCDDPLHAPVPAQPDARRPPLLQPHRQKRAEQGRRTIPSSPIRRDTGALNQTLDEHLLGVTKHAGVINHALPGFEHHLPRLARHKGLRKRSQDARFRWQDRATDTAAAMRERAARQGAFIVNMASTGCGKTLANARIMNALADPLKGMRCAFALGLRTLTLQTGRAFRDLLGLSDAELAIKVGGAASRELFEFHERQAEQSGSASSQSLLPEDGHVLFEGNAEHPLLQRLSRDAQVRSLLAAPLLVCTVDHLTPATESQRGGRQIAPMLRLLSGDLVLDEPTTSTSTICRP
jgi:CRISPR-associated endonuclease/helicase Cas3